MDKDRIKGKSKEIKGRIKRQIGEWIGKERMQVGGAARGKIQNAWVKLKDFGREIPERRIVRKREEDLAA